MKLISLFRAAWIRSPLKSTRRPGARCTGCVAAAVGEEEEEKEREAAGCSGWGEGGGGARREEEVEEGPPEAWRDMLARLALAGRLEGEAA